MFIWVMSVDNKGILYCVVFVSFNKMKQVDWSMRVFNSSQCLLERSNSIQSILSPQLATKSIIIHSLVCHVQILLYSCTSYTDCRPNLLLIASVYFLYPRLSRFRCVFIFVLCVYVCLSVCLSVSDCLCFYGFWPEIKVLIDWLIDYIAAPGDGVDLVDFVADTGDKVEVDFVASVYAA